MTYYLILKCTCWIFEFYDYKGGLYHNVSDLANVCSNYGSSLLQKGPAIPHCPLEEVLHDAPSDGIDLVSKLLVFNPHKRLTAAQALQHVYVRRYIIGLNCFH